VNNYDKEKVNTKTKSINQIFIYSSILSYPVASFGDPEGNAPQIRSHDLNQNSMVG